MKRGPSNQSIEIASGLGIASTSKIGQDINVNILENNRGVCSKFVGLAKDGEVVINFLTNSQQDEDEFHSSQFISPLDPCTKEFPKVSNNSTRSCLFNDLLAKATDNYVQKKRKSGNF